MKFSIIIPVYKVEAYINSCIDSVLLQDFDDFEVILVDDGSPDRCPQICDEYAKKDSRIKVIHKSNGGLSSARNAGIEAATGDYIVFLDSDDWIDQGCLNGVADLLENNPVELIMTNKTLCYGSETILEVDGFEDYLTNGFDKKRAVDWILHDSSLICAPNKILKKSFIDENNIRFIEGILHEDHDWTYKLCLKANTFAGYSKPWYNYRLNRDGSITNKHNWRNVISVLITTGIYFNLYKNEKNYYTKNIYHHIMGSLYSSLHYVNQMDDNSIKIIIEEVNKNKKMFSYAGKAKHFLFLIVLRIFGAKFAVNLLRRM